MKASWNWLCTLLPDLSAAPRDVASRLTLAGLEVEGLLEVGTNLASVVLARVQKIEPHPTRSSLRLVTVDRGGASQQVVCGAPNVPPPGHLVVLAPVGTRLDAKGLVLTPRDIGGVRSEGMLCSEAELGLGHEASGLWTPDPLAGEPGTPLPQAFPSVSDTIFEIGLTPNRADALSHLGLARELSALYGVAIKEPPTPAFPTSDETLRLHIVVEAAERCAVYGIAVMKDVAVKPSPEWLRHRLLHLGVRAIFNVVDITNYLMLLYGQPLHAFDEKKIRGAVLRVRQATEGETLVTLDGHSRTLSTDDLVIADAEGPTALAGVMGGQNSEVDVTTTELALECATFDPRSVRRTARRHALPTEASHRFERGIYGVSHHDVLAHAAHLIATLGGGRVVGAPLWHQAPPSPRTPVRFRPAQARSLLGREIADEQMVSWLTRLGCNVEPHESPASHELQIVPPAWRGDLHREVDLIEEVARMEGFDSIVPTLPALRPQPPRRTGKLETRVRTAAVALGLREALTYAFVSRRELELVAAPSPAVVIQNPLSEDRSCMRTSLLPGLLEAVARAQRYGERSLRYFATGNLFFASKGASPLPRQSRAFAAVLAGPRPAYLARPADHDVFDAKGIAEEIVGRATRHPARIASFDVADRPKRFHPRAAAQVWVENQALGTVGQLHPDLLAALEIEGTVVAVELDVAGLEALAEWVPQARVVPKLPPVTRDVALVVPDTLAAQTLEAMIREAAAPLCDAVEIFDLFQGGSLPPGHRSLAFHVVYRDPKARTAPNEARTLTDAEVDECHHAMVASVQSRLGVSLRT